MNQQMQKENYSDEAILNMFEVNNAEAVRMLYVKYHNLLVQFTSNQILDSEDAREMVQELYIYVFKRGIKLRNNNLLLPYLYKALRNRIKNRHRNQKTRLEHLYKYGLQSATIERENVSLEVQEIRRCLTRILNQIPEKLKVVYLLNRNYEYSVKDISSTLNKPYSTVEKQLRSAYRLIKEAFEKQSVIQLNSDFGRGRKNGLSRSAQKTA